MLRPYLLTETNLARLEEKLPEVAVLPLAAVEPHNRHLPEGQDWLHTSYVAEECCRIAWEATGRVICLPAIPYGVDCNLLDFPLAIHVRQAVLDEMVADIVSSLFRHNIRKIVLLNGHGGNDFVPLIRQLQSELDVHLFLVNWWTVGSDRYDEIFAEPDDHAGEMETSVALALYPHLVERQKAGHGRPRAFRFEALNKGWVKTSRNFAHLNDHCAAGDPRHATAEKGRKYLEIVLERISNFLIELTGTPIDKNFPLK